MKIVRVESVKHGLDPLLVAAVIYKESKFRKDLCYHGSHGLMQIQLKAGNKRTCVDTMPEAIRLGLYDPRKNIKAGIKMMLEWRRWWRKHHQNDGYHWLLHYNQGFGRCPIKGKSCSLKERIPVRVGRVGGYADRVMKIYQELKRK